MRTKLDIYVFINNALVVRRLESVTVRNDMDVYEHEKTIQILHLDTN